MKKRNTARAVAVAAALAGLAWPASQAFAQIVAYTSSPVDLYAGPSGDYPVVSQIGPGQTVTVNGCVSDYSWCDVSLYDLRGWVYAGYLTYPYQGQYVPLQGYGSVIGLPVIGFSLGAYWDNYYRNRPWYGERDRWAHVPAPGYGGHPPGPPAVRAQEGRPYGAPGAGVRPGPQGYQGGPGRPDAGMHGPAQPGANFAQPRGPAEQPGGMRPGAPAGGFEHGAPQMRAPGPGQMQGHPAAPQGGHPSGEGGGRGDNRQQGQ